MVGTTTGASRAGDSRAFLAGIAVLFLLGSLLVAGVVITGSGPLTAGSSEGGLVPKDDLPSIVAREGRDWTHAPYVPTATNRSSPAKVTVSWRATEQVIDLDPAGGLRYAAWGFEGSVPGPMLRVRVGDLIEVKLTNDIASTHPHNIDFHFATGPGGGAPALSVSPGETASVEVRAMAPGIYMYHCATPDIPTHIANGMYGYVIVEPEGGLHEVDQELYVVQSEFYVAPGNPATLDMSRLDNEEPSFVVLNGAVGSLMGENSPKVKVGDRVRIWYGNAGPQLISSFHVIGEIFDAVYREGDLISAPGSGIQTTLVPAGGATMVEFKVDVPGTYLLVDHAIARTIHKGMVGAIVAEGAERYEIFKPGRAAAQADDGHSPAASTVVTMTKGAWDQKSAAQAFTPHEATVKAGSTVTWKQADDVAHTVTSDDGKFDSGFVNPGKSFTYKFAEPGRYPYHCLPHPWMTGVVVVT